jgi:hypothetical protein
MGLKEGIDSADGDRAVGQQGPRFPHRHTVLVGASTRARRMGTRLQAVGCLPVQNPERPEYLDQAGAYFDNWVRGQPLRHDGRRRGVNHRLGPPGQPDQALQIDQHLPKQSGGRQPQSRRHLIPIGETRPFQQSRKGPIPVAPLTPAAQRGSDDAPRRRWQHTE